MGIFSDAVRSSRQHQVEQKESLLREVLSSFDDRMARAVTRAVEGKCSNW